MNYKTVIPRKQQAVFSKFSRIDLSVNSRSAGVNGTDVWLGFPVVEFKGMLYLSKRDYFNTIRPILYPQNSGARPKLFNVVIDPGHGGKDNGAINKYLKVSEKSVNLAIALKLGRELQKNGYRVSFTRTNDKFIELEDRPRIANAAKADLFVSIHANSADSSITGVETFVLTPRGMPSTTSSKVGRGDVISYPGNSFDPWNLLSAYYVQRALSAGTRSPDRGVKRARFAVLRTARQTAMLVECGFISNNAECRKLASSDYQQVVAQSIASGISAYHSRLRKLAK